MRACMRRALRPRGRLADSSVAVAAAAMHAGARARDGQVALMASTDVLVVQFGGHYPIAGGCSAATRG
jgi:hypothetical protein